VKTNKGKKKFSKFYKVRKQNYYPKWKHKMF